MNGYGVIFGLGGRLQKNEYGCQEGKCNSSVFQQSILLKRISICHLPEQNTPRGAEWTAGEM
jgi:hypothetical protein